jgi:hypothetical protein
VEPIEPSPPAIRYQTSGIIGTLHGKRDSREHSESSWGLDWALYTIDRNKMHLSNTVFLPNGNILLPRNIAQKDPCDMAVVIHTGTTGIVNGSIIGDYSLVALPGSRFFQRMWIVILDRPIRKFSLCLAPNSHFLKPKFPIEMGDSGSWVLDPTNGDWLGHIVAGKPGTNVAYIVLARDIVNDIATHFGGKAVRMPSEVELEVTEAVAEVKRAIRLPEPRQAPTTSTSLTSVHAKEAENTEGLRPQFRCNYYILFNAKLILF